MPLQRKRLVVGMIESDRMTEGEYVVDMQLGDQLRAELELRKRGVDNPAKSPVHFQSAIAWAALVRQHGYPSDFKQFGQDCAYVEAHKEDDPDDTVDPTTQAVSSDSA